MQTEHHIIKLHRPWATLPNVASLPALVKPIQTPPNDPYAEEFSETELRSLALEGLSDTLPGLSISPASIQALPPDYFSLHYLHVRYRKPLGDRYFPLRADAPDGVRFSTSVHSLGGMICMALTLKALLNRLALTIDPAKLREARNLALLLREVQFAVYTTLLKYPTASPAPNLIIGSYTAYDRSGNNVTSLYHVLFDEDRLASYLSADNTIQDAIDHWVANQTQPQW